MAALVARPSIGLRIFSRRACVTSRARWRAHAAEWSSREQRAWPDFVVGRLQSLRAFENRGAVMLEFVGRRVGRTMPQLDLQIANGSKPQHFLRASARREMVAVETETTTINPDALADGRVHVDAQADHKCVALRILIGREHCSTVPMRVELAINQRNASVVAQQQVSSKEPQRRPVRPLHRHRRHVKFRKQALGHYSEGACNIGHPLRSLNVRVVVPGREKVRGSELEDGDLEEPKPRHRLVCLRRVQAARLDEGEGRPCQRNRFPTAGMPDQDPVLVQRQRRFLETLSLLGHKMPHVAAPGRRALQWCLEIHCVTHKAALL
mmetsp:Transcript_45088/g.124985  ORF Transcript_45088/g.124985 Transcript_45088/m.124985 type:complete len:323 (+) Transcript_45088:519-1487(+)